MSNNDDSLSPADQMPRATKIVIIAVSAGFFGMLLALAIFKVFLDRRRKRIQPHYNV